MRRPKGRCASCGADGVPLSKGHILPDNLYPASVRTSALQLPTLRECLACNGDWSDDEAHFRSVLLLAGEPNDPVRELWTSKVARSFKELDGRRRVEDLHKMFVPATHNGEDRYMIYPARDERVVRILRKIVRGLSHYLGVERDIKEERVFADVLKISFPEGIGDEWDSFECVPNIFKCWYHFYNDEEISSLWLLRFYENRYFLARVSALGVVLEPPDW
jgi:hypothetical protein